MTHPLFAHFQRSLPAILLAATLCSCVHRTPYQPGSVKTAHLASVKVSPTMTFETRGKAIQRSLAEGIGSQLGVLGAVAGGSMEQSAHDAVQTEDQAMLQFYTQEVRRILAEEIHARGQFQVVNDPRADATLEVQGGEWGIRYIAGGAYSGKVGAIATINCILKDSSGRVLWDDNTFHIHRGKNARVIKGDESWGIHWFGYTRNHRKREEFVGRPDLIRQELSAAIRHRARQIASSLPQGSRSPAR